VYLLIQMQFFFRKTVQKRKLTPLLECHVLFEWPWSTEKLLVKKWWNWNKLFVFSYYSFVFSSFLRSSNDCNVNPLTEIDSLCRCCRSMEVVVPLKRKVFDWILFKINSSNRLGVHIRIRNPELNPIKEIWY